MESCKGYPQSATGSDDGWKINIFNRDNGDKCNNKPLRDPHEGFKWTSGDMYISKHGLSNIFLSQPGSPNTYGQDLSVFPIGETLVINVPDAAFGYPGMPELYNIAGPAGAGKMVKRCNVKNSFNENKQILNAWINWLDYKVNWDNIKGFYGVGASRGGCFVTLLADKLFKNELKGKGAKLILETLDPVCAPGELPDDVRPDRTGYTKEIDFPDNWKLLAAFGVILGLSLLLGPVGLLAAAALLATVSWTSGDKSILVGSPLANLGDNMEIRYPISNDNNNWKEQNQCHAMKLGKLFGTTPREDIRWLNVVSGENVLGGNVDWTAIYAFCSDKTLGPATDANTGELVYSQNWPNPSTGIDDTRIDSINDNMVGLRGSPKQLNQKFARNEDGNPIGQGVPYQNLWLDVENNAFVSGSTATDEINPVSWQSISNTWDSNGWPTNPPNPVPLPKSNNKMPGFGQHSKACGAWYKQFWVPFNHQTTTAGIYVPANPSADGVGVPCFGQASCGYGIHEPQNPDGSFPLPLQKRAATVKNCIPFPRADLDFSYKLAKHAHDAAVELFQGVDGNPLKKCDIDMTYSGEEWDGPSTDGLGSEPPRYSDEEAPSGPFGTGDLAHPIYANSGEEVPSAPWIGLDVPITQVGDDKELDKERLISLYDTKPITGEVLEDVSDTIDLNIDFKIPSKDDSTDFKDTTNYEEEETIYYGDEEESDSITRDVNVEISKEAAEEIAFAQAQYEKYGKQRQALIDAEYPNDDMIKAEYEKDYHK